MSQRPAKLSNRRSTDSVDRERLFERFDRTGAAPLVYVHGPAGAGKSTLVSSYLARRHWPVLWYRVDESDADAATAFSYLAQGAAAITHKRRLALPALKPEFLLDLPGFTRRFFRLFFEALPPHAVLVLDGFECAPGPVLQQLLLTAVAESPADHRVFVTSRSAPSEQVAHLLAKGAMAVIDWQDLRLTGAEAQAIAENIADVPAQQVRRLHELTDGWAAGFVVLLACLRRTGSVDTLPEAALEGQLFPYYLNELLQGVDPVTLALLLRTALLPGFTLAQAASLAPEADTEAVLNWLVQHHFFIERSVGASPVYRYHALFREFLLREGRQRLVADERSALQRLAADLLLVEQEHEAALSLLLDAQAWPQAAGLINKLAPRLLEHGRMATLEAFIAAVPAGSNGLEHWLLFWRGVATLLRDQVRARTLLEAAYTAFASRGESVGQLMACASIIDSYFVGWNELGPVDRWADTFYELLRQHRGDMPAEVEVRVLTSMAALTMRGHRHAAMIDYGFRRALDMLAWLEEPALRMPLAGLVIMVMYFRGDWQAGQRFIAETEATLPPAAQMPQHAAFWHSMKARVLVYDGDSEVAFAAAAQAERVAADYNIVALEALAASVGVYAGLNADDLERAQACLARMRVKVAPSRRLDVMTVEFQSALVELARGRADRAAVDLRAVIGKALDLGADLFAAQFRIVLALALIETGKLPAATEELHRVADYAHAAGLAVLEHSGLMVRAWLAHRAGHPADSLALLRVALPLGREQGYRVIWPWVPLALLQDLGLLALRHDIEPAYTRELLRLRRVPPPAPDADAWPWRIRVFTLGRFELLIDDRPLQAVPKAPKKPLELLKALIALSGLGDRGGVSMGAIVHKLWPDLDGAAAQNAFNVALHRLRKLLGDEQAVLLQDGRVRLDARRVWTDAHSFSSFAERPVGDDAQAVVVQLLGLYAGPFLADDEAPWAASLRERLHSRFLRSATALSDQLIAAGRLNLAVDLQRRVIEIDPLAETFHRDLMRSLHALGRQAEALEAYRRCRDLLARLLGTSPSTQTEKLRQVIAR